MPAMTVADTADGHSPKGELKWMSKSDAFKRGRSESDKDKYVPSRN